MRFLSALSLAVLFNSVPAFAVEAPIPASGDFAYSGDYIIESVQRSETVFSQFEEGQKRLKELRQEGYECVPKYRQAYLCRKFLAPSSERLPFIDAELDCAYEGFTFLIDEAGAPPALEYESPEFASWSTGQKVNLMGKTYSMVRYTWNSGLYKLWLMNSEGKGDVDFVYVSESELTETHFFRQISGRIRDEYMVSARLSSRR